MEPSADELRRNYERFDDEKLVRLATREATKLRPEALEVLKRVMTERGLPEDVFKGIEVQFREIDESQLHDYYELMRALPCPICGSSTKRLNATIADNVVSFIILTNHNKDLIVACPDCLDKKNNSAMIKSALLGWWGLPWGIIKTIQALLFNYKMKQQNQQPEANETLRSFVRDRIGRIEASKNNPTELHAIIQYIQ